MANLRIFSHIYDGCKYFMKMQLEEWSQVSLLWVVDMQQSFTFSNEQPAQTNTTLQQTYFVFPMAVLKPKM